MQSKVSVRGQTVIPAPVRAALDIKPNQKLVWRVSDGMATVMPIPEDPIKAARGFLKGKGSSFEAFMRDRNEERAMEEELDNRWKSDHNGA